MKSKWRRATQKDRDRLTFIDFLETLLDNKNCNIHKNVNGTLAMRLADLGSEGESPFFLLSVPSHSLLQVCCDPRPFLISRRIDVGVVFLVVEWIRFLSQPPLLRFVRGKRHPGPTLTPCA